MTAGIVRPPVSVLGLAVALALSVLAACSEDPETVPRQGLKVWIAQGIEGRATAALSSSGVSGVTIVFRAGLNEDVMFEIARDVTDSDGRFEMLAAGSPQGDAGFWRFIIDEDYPRDLNGDVMVYCALRAIKGNLVQDYPFELTRKPRTTLPPSSSGFFLMRSVNIPWA